jgi:uncharacterized protein (TIGR00299 family) protein
MTEISYCGWRNSHLKIAYFDCSSGISGDMCLGALVDAGISAESLEKELGKIHVRGYKLSVKKVKRSHFTARKVDVLLRKEDREMKAGINRWAEIEKLVHDSSLCADIKKRGLTIFKRLFDAEAKVHGESLKTVHLHEIGALDCIADIFGTIIGLDMLGIERVYASPLNLGSGFVSTKAGIIPVPAPATAEILKKVPVYSKSISSELITPTGAAIIRELSSGFGDIPMMDVAKIGIGAGSRDFKGWPNVLRILIGNSLSPAGRKKETGEPSDETVTVIETNIDDMNPQVFEYVAEKLFRAGALDVYFTQVIMKKGRPGVKLTVLCDRKKEDTLMKIVLGETSTIGLRFHEVKRRVLRRQVVMKDTEFGKLRVKIAGVEGDIVKVSPEYEDCVKIAKRLGIPLIEVMKKLR